MTERVLKTLRGDVHYWVTDDRFEHRDTLIFLHGLTADHRMFQDQVSCFSEQYNLIAWDAPAHGASRPYRDFTYPNAAEDLLAVLDACQVQRPVLIGQSMGGFVAQSFLMRYPDRAKAFISIDSCPYGESYYSRSDRWWLRQIEWMSAYFPMKLLKDSITKQVARTSAARETMRMMLEPYGKQELCHLMGVGYAGFLEDNRDMELPCPTLLIVGERDVTGKVLHYNRAWTKNTGFPLRMIPNAAHNSNDDNPEAVNREIQMFLDGVGE